MTAPEQSPHLGATEGGRVVLDGARQDATDLGDGAIGGEHLLASLFRRSSRAGRALEALGLSPAQVAEELLLARGKVAKGPAGDSPDAAPAELVLTSQARRLLEVAARQASQRSAEPDDAHLLLAAAAEPRGPFARILEQAGKTTFELRREAVRAVDGDAAADALVPPAPKKRQERAERPAAEAASAEAGAAPAAAAAREERAPRAERAPQSSKPAEPAKGQEKPKGQEKREKQERPEKGPRADRAQDGEKRSGAPARSEGDARREKGRDRREAPVERDQDDEPRAPKVPSIGRIKPAQSGPLWRTVLLAAVPVALALNFYGADPRILFVVTCLAVLPVASYMGEATEHLAEHTGPTTGGLLNATFGNAAELIIASVALRSGYVELVKASLIGSILGNLLLILGLSIVAGGLGQHRLKFNRTGTGMSASMLALSVVGMVFPAIFHAAHPTDVPGELYLSEAVAVILIVTYGFSLLFSLKTHSRLLAGAPHPLEGPTWSVLKGVTVLGAATVVIAFLSEILVHTTEKVAEGFGLSELFLGLIVVPIIGNAAEHAAAIVVARKGQMDLAFQISLGSSTQIAMLVAPVLVFLGVAFGQPMNLVFSAFEVAALGVSVVVVSILTLDGESHWFEGVQLLAVFGMLAFAAFMM